MKRLLFATSIVIVVLVGAGLYLRTTRDTETVVNAESAAKIVGAVEPAAEIDPGLRPAAGVYTYVGGGSEHITLLGGSTHTFPKHITGIIQLDAKDSCAWKLDLVLVAEHTERRRFCTTRAGTVDAGFHRRTSFLGHDQTSTYACDDTAFRAKPAVRPGGRWSWTCTEARGGKVRYTATYVGPESIDVAGIPVRTMRVRITARQRDKSTGDERGDWWFLASGLPVRMQSDRAITRKSGPLGTMRSTEQFRYELTALRPTRIAGD